MKTVFLVYSLISLNFLFSSLNVVAKENSRLGINYKTSFQLYTKEKKISAETPTLTSLNNLLKTVSETKRLQDSPPLSLLILHRRAKSDLKKLQQALRSRGYYSANISYQIDKSLDKPIVKRIGKLGIKENITIVQFKIILGQPYTFNNVTIKVIDGITSHKLLKVPSARDIGLLTYNKESSDKDKIADARLVKKAEKKLIALLKAQSFAYVKISAKSFIVDHKKQTMDVFYEINPGPSISLGSVTFKGTSSVNTDFLDQLIAWQYGDLYHPDIIKKTTKNILQRNLFSTIRIELNKTDLAEKSRQQTIPVIIHLSESLHRSIKSSIGFDTDTGPSLGATWSHRNFFSAGEKISVEAAWTGVGPLVDIKFNKPYFYHPQQNLFSNLKLQNEDTDAYDSSSFNMGAGLERKLIEGASDEQGLTLSLGLAFRYSEISSKSISELESNVSADGTISTVTIDPSQNFSLLYLPFKVNWDFSNDFFDPYSGGKLLLEATPYIDIQSNLSFGKIFTSYVQYLKLQSQPRLVLAGRFALGQILAAESYQLPADERLYSGGGGSVRGYGYQLIGPLDKNNNPLGGNSLLEFAIESRYHFTETMGGVIFIDGGSSFTDSFFDGSSNLLYGAGVGFRYASPMGPLRADIAIPVNPREDIDDAFQIYLSIGQAF